MHKKMNIKKTISILVIIFLSTCAFAQWKPAGDKIKTKWTDSLDPKNILSEYPRPIMERCDWLNLNGLWFYAILPVGGNEPVQFDGKILVPFAIESSLSGVQKSVDEKHELWYERTFSIPSKWKDKDILLNFGAVDWKAEVFINDVKIGTHTGGYTPFSFDITPFIKPGKQKLVVKVFDGTDSGFQPRGKQVAKPEGIWYTSVTGIWQTVWIEPVNKKHISGIKNYSDIENCRLFVNVNCKNSTCSDMIIVKVSEGSNVISTEKGSVGQELELAIPNAKLWTPESPFLYDINIDLISNGKIVDHVKSYSAMRKVSVKKDVNGIIRMQLNNKDYFQFGTLDQGWWPDGLYTAPTDEALLYDIKKTKEFGFNMIRKHVKVEPARWYTYCDRLGILVWQDMPSGDKIQSWQNHQFFVGNEMLRTAESESNYRKEWREIIDNLYSYPSIIVWVPFNEGWGQFKTVDICDWTKSYDPSRLVNSASGGNFFKAGDILDLHNYPGPDMYLYDTERVNVIGEYGGIGLPVESHLWRPEKNWGYIQFKNSKEVTDEYIKYAQMLKKMIKAGFSAAIYTQITDVEVEVNGLMTYDRKVIKIDEDRVKRINKEVCNSLAE